MSRTYIQTLTTKSVPDVYTSGCIQFTHQYIGLQILNHGYPKLKQPLNILPNSCVKILHWCKLILHNNCVKLLHNC